MLLLSRVVDLHHLRILAAAILVSLEGAIVFIDDLHDFAHSFLADQQTCRQCTCGLAGFRSLLNLNSVSLRRNSIGHHFKVTHTSFHAGRYVELGFHETCEANGHGTVAMGTAVEDVAGSNVG